MWCGWVSLFGCVDIHNGVGVVFLGAVVWASLFRMCVSQVLVCSWGFLFVCLFVMVFVYIAVAVVVVAVVFAVAVVGDSGSGGGGDGGCGGLYGVLFIASFNTREVMMCDHIQVLCPLVNLVVGISVLVLRVLVSLLLFGIIVPAPPITLPSRALGGIYVA